MTQVRDIVSYVMCNANRKSCVTYQTIVDDLWRLFHLLKASILKNTAYITCKLSTVIRSHLWCTFS